MIKKKDNINIKNTFNKLSINKGDKILITSSILKLLIRLKKNSKKFNANLIIDTLLDKVGPQGTIMFPTYNWDFCQGKTFDYKKTKSLSGSLGNFALERKDFKRTKNPIYSFAVAGKDRDYICNLEHEDCFSLNSPFGYLIENHAKNLFIDIDYKGGFTLIHVAEQTSGVDYRYNKNFEGFYIDEFLEKRKVNYRMYVRNLSLKVTLTAISEQFDKVLIKNKAYKKSIINNVNFTLVDIFKAYELLLDDLNLKNGLIYPSKDNKEEFLKKFKN